MQRLGWRLAILCITCSSNRAVNVTSLATLRDVVGLPLVAVENPPFVFVDVDGNGGYSYRGLAIDVLTELSKSLNFLYTITHIDSSVSYNQFVQIAGNGSFAMGVGDVTITEKRSETVNFAYPYFDLGLTFVFRDFKRPAPGIWQIFSPFTGRLWGLVGGFALVIVLMLWYFEANIGNEDFQSTSAHTAARSLAVTVYVTLALLLQQLSHKPESLEGYIISFGWMLFTFIMAATYTAQLASVLTTSSIQETLTLSQLQNGNIAQDKVVIYADSAIELAYQRFILNCDGASCASFNYAKCYSADECFQMVADGRALATVYDSPVAAYLIQNKYCGLSTSSTLFALQNYGFVLPQGAAFIKEVDQAILHIREQGTIERIARQYTLANACDSSSSSTVRPLDTLDFAGLYYIMLCSMGIALFLHFLRKTPRGRRVYDRLKSAKKGAMPMLRQRARGGPSQNLFLLRLWPGRTSEETLQSSARTADCSASAHKPQVPDPSLLEKQSTTAPAERMAPSTSTTDSHLGHRRLPRPQMSCDAKRQHTPLSPPCQALCFNEQQGNQQRTRPPLLTPKLESHKQDPFSVWTSSSSGNRPQSRVLQGQLQKQASWRSGHVMELQMPIRSNSWLAQSRMVASPKAGDEQQKVSDA